MYSCIWFDACRTISRCIFKLQNNYESIRCCIRLCRGAGQPGGGTKTNLSLFDKFTISIMCALCGAMPHCYRLFFLRPKSWFDHENSAQLASVEISFHFPCSRCIFIVALACSVRLTFQVQVYYHRWCNGCARGVGSTNTNERPVSFVSG